MVVDDNHQILFVISSTRNVNQSLTFSMSDPESILWPFNSKNIKTIKYEQSICPKSSGFASSQLQTDAPTARGSQQAQFWTCWSDVNISSRVLSQVNQYRWQCHCQSWMTTNIKVLLLLLEHSVWLGKSCADCANKRRGAQENLQAVVAIPDIATNQEHTKKTPCT